MVTRARREFERRFGEPPTHLVRSPGRVNLLGEHTDYNQGFVLPMAIDRGVKLVFRPSEDRCVTAHSLAVEDPVEIDLRRLTHGGPAWGEYLRGAAWTLAEEGLRPAGWRGVFTSDLPFGAGLSSSAALELAAAAAYAVAGALAWDPVAMAKRSQRAEREWVGVECGVMDPLVSALAVPGCALLIDCRSLATEAVPLPEEFVAIVLDTGTRRDLSSSAYNTRRWECEEAAQALGAGTLREVTLAQVERLEGIPRRRARHVVLENRRVQQAAEALRKGDGAALGRLMSFSHESLRDDFEVSTPALDAMAKVAVEQVGCVGARMTGAGFGGCAVAWVEREAASDFTREVLRRYHEETGLTAEAYGCRPVGGTELRVL